MNILTNFVTSLHITHGEVVFFLSVLSILFIEEVFRFIKSKMKKRIYSKFAETNNPEATDFYIEYYRKSQVIDVVRVGLFIMVIVYVILTKAPSMFNFFAIATGAMIIIFKDFILSFIAFFFIISQYKIGDTIAIGDAKGEIIYIRPFYTGIIGRDERSEHTGELHILPNGKFFTDPVKKQELNVTSYRKHTLEIPYNPETFSDSFDVFLVKLEGFLNTKLPLRSAKGVGNYTSFIGCKYKLDFHYNDISSVHVCLSFVGRSNKI